MHRGELRAVGTPTKLKSALSPAATLEDVFRHYAASDLSQQTDSSGSSESLRSIRSSRKVARRAG
jgi:ABC-2 type transport system ATP-binding protein